MTAGNNNETYVSWTWDAGEFASTVLTTKARYGVVAHTVELHQALVMKSLTLLMAQTLLAKVLLQERSGDFILGREP